MENLQNVFEVHITVKADDVEKWKADCATFGVKPLVLDLQDYDGKTVMMDFMTSSVYKGEKPTDELQYMWDLEEEIREAGYFILRRKIESTPFHKLVPTRENKIEMPETKYFESHLRVLCNDDEVSGLRKFCKKLKLPISKNTLKQLPEGQQQILVTIRNRDKKYIENFTKYVENIKQKFLDNSYNVDKLEIEYAQFDTNSLHDKAWFK